MHQCGPMVHKIGCLYFTSIKVYLYQMEVVSGLDSSPNGEAVGVYWSFICG